MASKKDAIDILNADLATKIGEIEKAFTPTIKAQKDAIKKIEASTQKSLLANIRKAVQPVRGAAVQNPQRLYQGYQSPIGIDYSKIATHRKAKQHLDKTFRKKDEEINSLRRKAAGIQRQIKLHGVNEEILLALESL